MSFSRMAAKQSPPWSRMRSGKRGSNGGNFRSGTVGRDQLRQLGQAQHAVDQDHVLRLGLQALDDEVAQIVGHRGLDLDPHHRAQAALLQPRLELAHQVFGLFLDLDVAVADQAEQALALDLAAGEQLVEEQDQEAFQREEPPRVRLRAAAAAAAPRTGRPGSAPAPGRRAACRRDSRCSFSASEKPRLGMNGNGWAGSIASGVSTGKMLAEEDLLDRQARSAAVTSLASSSTQAFAGQLGAQRRARCAAGRPSGRRPRR